MSASKSNRPALVLTAGQIINEARTDHRSCCSQPADNFFVIRQFVLKLARLPRSNANSPQGLASPSLPISSARNILVLYKIHTDVLTVKRQWPVKLRKAVEYRPGPVAQLVRAEDLARPIRQSRRERSLWVARRWYQPRQVELVKFGGRYLRQDTPIPSQAPHNREGVETRRPARHGKV